MLAPLDFAEVVRETVDFITPTAENHHLFLFVEIPKTLPEIAADKNEIVSIITNLLHNAKWA